jgi:hypothetical protein
VAERRPFLDPKRALVADNIEPGVRFASGVRRRSQAGDTVYFCTADADGLVVSNIQSIYHDFGAAVISGVTARWAARASRIAAAIFTVPLSAISTVNRNLMAFLIVQENGASRDAVETP